MVRWFPAVQGFITTQVLEPAPGDPAFGGRDLSAVMVSTGNMGHWLIGCVIIFRSKNQGEALWFLAELWYYQPELIKTSRESQNAALRTSHWLSDRSNCTFQKYLKKEKKKCVIFLWRGYMFIFTTVTAVTTVKKNFWVLLERERVCLGKG